jgi:hypothetical protein
MTIKFASGGSSFSDSTIGREYRYEAISPPGFIQYSTDKNISDLDSEQTAGASKIKAHMADSPF